MEIDSVGKAKQQFRKKHGGRGSRAARNDKFRLKKSEAAMKEIHAAARARTFEGIDQQFDLLQELKVEPVQQQVQLPITTRGVGFLACETHDFIRSVVPRVNNLEFSSLDLYKIGLLQLSAQIHLAHASLSKLADPLNVEMEDPFIPTDLLEAVKPTANETIAVSSLPASMVGCVTDGQAQYLPYVPAVHLNREPDQGLRRKRVRPSNRRVAPHPYYVTAMNAHFTVQALADNEVNIDIRRWFRENNPIPRARWEGDRLVNPNDLFPADWLNINNVHRLVRNFQAYRSAIAGKLSTLLGPLSLDGKGQRGMLASQFHYRMQVDDDQVLCGESESIRSSNSLTSQELMLGGLALVGEYPDQPAVYGPVSAFSALRHPSSAITRIEVLWSGLANGCLQKR